MKKTLLLLLIAVGSATGADDIYWTFDSGEAGTGNNFNSRRGLSFTLTSNASSYDVTSSSKDIEFPDYHLLKTITIWTPQIYSHGIKGILMTSDDFTILATSVSTATGNNNGTDAVFDFSSSEVVLSSNVSYTLAVTTYNNAKDFSIGSTAPSNEGDYINLQFYASTATKTQDNNLGFMAMNNGNFEKGRPAVNIVTKGIPEPTTATLSLLALAGLAARRRRK